MILRRPGFDPRRVFMAPETIHYPIKRGNDVSGTINVTLSLPKNDLVSDDLYLCYPGGEKAVGICNLTPLYQADKINLLILNKQGIEGWKFAMRLAARFRKENIAFLCRIETLLESHPYDLSGGEKQLLALAMVLAQKPRLLLMDEPTKGLDACAKKQYAQALKALRAQGTAIVIVTHDTAFAARCADRCLLLFRGQVVAEDVPGAFFGTNLFYTTPISRMTRGLLPGCVTVEDAAALLGGASSADRKGAGV